jgi:sec-independent protein translocase protein TatC
MDDSDRSRDEPSAPEDGSVADDAADDGGTDVDGDEPDSDDGGDPADPVVSPEVTPEVDGATAIDDSDSDDAAIDDSDSDAAATDDSEADTDPSDGSGGDDTSEGSGGDDTDDASDTTESVGDGGTPATIGDAPPEPVDDATIADDGAAGDSVEGLEAPESDEEMPLAAHIEEMMRRLAVVFLFGGLATLVVVTESTELINYFWSYHIPAPLENRPRLYGPLELPLTRLKVAGLAGVVVGLPAFVYQTYRFMKPGLYENERRYYLAAVPTSLVLGGIGIAFAHFLVLPAIFSYFTTYTSDAATIAFGLAETFNLIVIMLAFMAIVFQIPLFIMLAIMMNLVTRQWLEAKRLLFWGAFLGIAFLFSPDPTGMAPIIVTLTMIALYEGTLAILRWTGN